jgi:hypothetical protein
MFAKSSHSRKKITAFLTIAVLVIGLILLEITGVTHLFHAKPMQTTAGPATKGELHLRNQDQVTGSDSTKQSSAEEPNSSQDTPNLLAPSGVFVSNHHPNLSGSPAPSQIQSVCTSTSGAVCAVVFTKGTISKSLPFQTTDSEGSTYWTWRLQDAGLTVGTWHIKAVAKLNGQVKSTDDAMDLVVAE